MRTYSSCTYRTVPHHEYQFGQNSSSFVQMPNCVVIRTSIEFSISYRLIYTCSPRSWLILLNIAMNIQGKAYHKSLRSTYDHIYKNIPPNDFDKFGLIFLKFFHFFFSKHAADSYIPFGLHCILCCVRIWNLTSAVRKWRRRSVDEKIRKPVPTIGREHVHDKEAARVHADEIAW